MIHALDHIVIAARSVDAAVASYRLLLGRRADSASFRLANVRLDLRTHDGATVWGLSALTFAAGDMEKPQRLLQQRALPVTPADEGRKSRVLHIAPAATHGVAISVLEDSSGNGVPPLSPLESAEEAGAVASLDHV